MSGRRLYRNWGKFLAFVANRVYGYEVNDEDKDNLNLARECLKDGSLVVYINHPSLADGPLAITYLLDNFGSYAKIIGGPESRKHSDFTREPRDALILRLTAFLGIRMIPIVQHYDRGQYEREEIFATLRKFVKGYRDILVPGGIFLIAPEGTRSPDGTLQEAQKGIGHLLKYKRSSIHFLPMAIIPEDTIDRGLNLGKKFNIRIGRPYSREEIEEIEISEGFSPINVLMSILASLLPPEMQGVYALYTDIVQ